MRPERRPRFLGAQAAAGKRVEGGRVGATLLLVEDDQSIGGLVRDYLTGEGHAVVWVRSGEEALAEYPRHPVRLVVLDIGLPGIDGLVIMKWPVHPRISWIDRGESAEIATHGEDRYGQDYTHGPGRA
jgi:hypothetical protein